MKSVVIIGAGDLGKEVVWIIEDINRIKPSYMILGFLDDDADKLGEEFYGYKVLGGIDALESLSERTPFGAILAIQDGSTRKRIVENHSSFKRWETIIHPSAVVASSSKVGTGSIVFPQTVISVDSKMGDFCLYYTRSTICCDCELGSFVSLMTGASVLEHTKIGDECFLSTGSCVRDYRTLGNRVKVAVKETVSDDCDDDVLVGM